jgi:hypothetical protein
VAALAALHAHLALGARRSDGARARAHGASLLRVRLAVGGRGACIRSGLLLDGARGGEAEDGRRRKQRERAHPRRA